MAREFVEGQGWADTNTEFSKEAKNREVKGPLRICPYLPGKGQSHMRNFPWFGGRG